MARKKLQLKFHEGKKRNSSSFIFITVRTSLITLIRLTNRNRNAILIGNHTLKYIGKNDQSCYAVETSR